MQDLNGDALPDLVVANQGSNDLTVLFGQSNNADWSLVPGPRLAAGDGPASTIVQDANRDGLPDIVVTNSRSNDVMVLPAVGGGFFNDHAPFTIPVGVRPVQIIPFPGPNGTPGAATVNAGSNDLTLIPDLTSGSNLTRTVASGGTKPVAAFAGDFNRDGFLDLVVANNGNGLIALLLGGADGPRLEQTLSRAGANHPTALVPWSLSGDTLEFFASYEGNEAAHLFSLSTGLPVPIPTIDPAPPPPVLLDNGIPILLPESEDSGEAARAPTADVHPLQESDFALVVILFSSSFDRESTSRPATAELDVLSLTNPSSPAVRFIIGLDSAFRHGQHANDEGSPHPLPGDCAEKLASTIKTIAGKITEVLGQRHAAFRVLGSALRSMSVVWPWLADFGMDPARPPSDGTDLPRGDSEPGAEPHGSPASLLSPTPPVEDPARSPLKARPRSDAARCVGPTDTRDMVSPPACPCSHRRRARSSPFGRPGSTASPVLTGRPIRGNDAIARAGPGRSARPLARSDGPDRVRADDRGRPGGPPGLTGTAPPSTERDGREPMAGLNIGLPRDSRDIKCR